MWDKSPHELAGTAIDPPLTACLQCRGYRPQADRRPGEGGHLPEAFVPEARYASEIWAARIEQER